MKKLPIILLSIALCLSLAANGALLWLRQSPAKEEGEAAPIKVVGPHMPLAAANNNIDPSQAPNIHFSDANSRPTYFTLHHVAEAHKTATGAGVKVGILDWNFDAANNPDLFVHHEDFTGQAVVTERYPSHGYWMAETLREIAPGCEIYAMTTVYGDEARRVEALVKAIDWAIEHDLDILTYSQGAISEPNRAPFYEAIARAAESGIVTTFINCGQEDNFLPGTFYVHEPYAKHRYYISIFGYDYNTIPGFHLEPYLKDYSYFDTSDSILFQSYSSTSPVLAGFVAILKSINDTLTPQQYKEILINTSYSVEYEDPAQGYSNLVPRVADIAAAVEYLQEHY